jgi:hypothetical protein
VQLAAGLYLFLPLVGRRNAGVKFYRLMLLITAALVFAAGVAQWLAAQPRFLPASAALLLLTLLVWVVLRYPKRLIYLANVALLGALYVLTSVAMFHFVVRPSNMVWSIAGSLSSIAILGSVNLAMLLGHWYLVVRGMSIDPLKRLTIATLASTVARVVVVALTVMLAGSAMREIVVTQGIFFWMRVGWGLLAPLALYPMVWGTVKIRSTMAATGILYVDVVAVVIGEVLGIYLSALQHRPL